MDVDATKLRSEHDAVVLCTGATWPRDLKIANRSVDGIHFAMEYLQVCYSQYIFLSSTHNLRSQTLALFWTPISRMASISVRKTRMSLSLAEEIQEMTVLEQPCVMVRSRLPTSNFCPSLLHPVVATTLGHNGPGMFYEVYLLDVYS